jgi:hypothetical protein
MIHMFSERMFASVFYFDVAYFSHMLQEYVPMVSAVSVLCYSKCFHVVSYKYSDPTCYSFFSLRLLLWLRKKQLLFTVARTTNKHS